ncbi:hypothetical protein FHX81_6933 [Saccharothrix saharensis]|uniref:Uncharacterized protein n=1 Tax=Saccharothrix saharensis TaxID=571190 RepID=A0A543JNQ7_9PSEU|nr:hypothetical protein [Saccharothrix saharensis]TQM84487.1 hypothetical protein FHX81_6933 [Saccharothrix saharensis]
MTDEVGRPAPQPSEPHGRQVHDLRPPAPLPSARLLDLRPVSGVPIACTLTGDEKAKRVDEWRALLDGARPEGITNGLRWRLSTARAGAAAELAAAEQRCCAFFDFTLRLTEGELVLEAYAPEDAAELFLDVFGTPAGTVDM